MTTTCTPAAARRLTRDVLVALGTAPHHADVTAEQLVLADQRGVMTHGLTRLPLYAERIERGDCRVDRAPEIVVDRGAVLVVDGHHHLGQVVGDLAMRAAVARAGELGAGVASVRRSSHFGAAGGYVLLATAAGRIGIAMTNAARLMAPTGGTARRVGNNPVAVGVPVRDGSPIVLDIAMSAVAAWSVRMAAERGQPIPDTWGLDRTGRPTTDAYEVFQGGGLLRPLGDHKGYGLALVVDVLAGVLSGGGFGDEVRRLDQSGPVDASHLFIALDIASFIDPDAFGDRLAALTAQVRDSPLAPGVEQVLLPGEREAAAEDASSRAGIPYPDDVLGPVLALADRLGVEVGQLTSERAG